LRLATGSTERPPDRHALGRSRGRSIRTYRDDGDTLIEILVTIAIVGLTIAAIMGAFVVDVKGSVEHRQLATNDIIAKDFAESATNQIELATTSPAFFACASISGAATTTSQITYAGQRLEFQPTDKSYAITATIQYLNNDSTFLSQADCQANPDQYLPELITATVEGPKGSTAKLSFVVTDPSQLESNYWPTTTTTIPSTTTTTTTVPMSTTTTPSTTSTTVPPTIKVSGITGDAFGTQGAWYALVTVAVEDQNSALTAGVLVTGTWTTNVTSYISSCTTDASGICSVYDGEPQQFGANDAPETFTVSGLSLVGHSYDSRANSPNPPAVTVSKP